ncbi:biotinidase-like [Neocloeon triangulifer]|uniref:biotinidase-like n=1 Tax=Neocloeon triangulifer TaxID=2078957 RepID=UPI00286EFD23|nr:biotinidase-like [Neocloeon triangulifer]
MKHQILGSYFLFFIYCTQTLVSLSNGSSKIAKRTFAIETYAWTAVGWNETDIESSILDDNLQVMEESKNRPHFNSSAIDYISIFPEYALTTTEVIHNRTLAGKLAQRVPEPGNVFVPCKVGSNDPDELVITRLSCLSRNNYAYTVASLLEKVPRLCGMSDKDCDGLRIYSTTVVFDKNGYLIAKYRRFNLIHETALDAAPSFEPITFTTESNVTFGLLTGYDLLFLEPFKSLLNKSVHHFIFNGAWQNKMPFEFSTSVEMGWVEANKKNNPTFLTSSNYQRAELGYSGFGIFFPSGSYSVSHPVGSGGYLSLGMAIEDPINLQEKRDEQKFSREVVADEGMDLSNYTAVAVPLSSQSQNSIEVCHSDGFCCTLTYQTFSSGSSATTNYQLLAFNGNRTAADGRVLFNEQTCGLVACSGTDKLTCIAPKSETTYTDNVFFTRLWLAGNFSSDQVRPVTMAGDENSYISLGQLSLTIQPQEGGYNVSYYNNQGRAVKVKTFALSSTDFPVRHSTNAANFLIPQFISLNLCIIIALRRIIC